MVSFFKLYESSQVGKDLWFKSPDVDAGADLEIIQRGLEIRADRTDGNTFWDDFIAVFSQNTEDAAKLLGVPRDRVAKWPQKVRRMLDLIRQRNDNSDTGEKEGKKKKNEMIPTGSDSI